MKNKTRRAFIFILATLVLSVISGCSSRWSESPPTFGLYTGLQGERILSCTSIGYPGSFGATTTTSPKESTSYFLLRGSNNVFIDPPFADNQINIMTHGVRGSVRIDEVAGKVELDLIETLGREKPYYELPYRHNGIYTFTNYGVKNPPNFPDRAWENAGFYDRRD